MNVLILPTSTGEGHNHASQAVQEYLDAHGAETSILDVLNIGKKNGAEPVSAIYDGLVNHAPAAFGFLYGLGEKITSSKHHSPIYYLNTLYMDSLRERIAQMNPQVIVCPHMFSALAVTRLVEKDSFNIPTVGLLTDYTCAPFWEETKLNCYVTANAKVAEECVARGIPREKLFPLGIPVSPQFRLRIPKEEARAAFGIMKEKVFVIAGGGMGYGKIPQISAELARVRDAQVVAVCGHNAALFDEVKKIPDVIALPYIENMSALMDAADVMLTKPGGLTVTEAMTKRVPLVLTLPIPGGEERNAEFLAEMGLAVAAHTVRAAADAAYRLLNDEEEREKMLAAQTAYCGQNTVADISNLILALGEGRAV